MCSSPIQKAQKLLYLLLYQIKSDRKKYLAFTVQAAI